MHRLGFDHEHSRTDRDENIQIFKKNIKGKHHNFEINFNDRHDHVGLSPYDFMSIMHYNSNAQQMGSDPVIVTKVPALLSKGNTLDIDRKSFSKIDILQIQNFYECNEIQRPIIRKAVNNDDLSFIEETKER